MKNNINYREVVADVAQVAMRRVVSDRELAALQNGTLGVAVLAGRVEEMAIELHYSILEAPERIAVHATHEYPSDWWQAFRERWFPKWWLKRWPVDKRVVVTQQTKVYNVCPHLPIDPKVDHIRFLFAEELPKL